MKVGCGLNGRKKSKELDWHALSFQDDRCEPPKERTCWEIETCRAADCESAAHWRLLGSGHRSLPLHRAGRDTIRFVSRISPGQREDRVSIQRLVFPSIKFPRLRRCWKIDLPRKNLRNVSIFLKTENDLFFRYRIVSSTISHLAVNIVERSISKRRRRNAASPKANRIRNIVDKSRVNQNQTRRNSHLASIERTIQSI